MIVRLDQLPIEFPKPTSPSPNSAAAVQELLGGKFGEMSTLVTAGQQAVPAKLQRHGYPFRFRELEPALRDILR